jgi:hypothetical protein
MSLVPPLVDAQADPYGGDDEDDSVEFGDHPNYEDGS